MIQFYSDFGLDRFQCIDISTIVFNMKSSNGWLSWDEQWKIATTKLYHQIICKDLKIFSNKQIQYM